MEEILASIRKIISDDGPEPAAADAPASDVIELTQMVQDDGSIVDLKDPEPVLAPEPLVPPRSYTPPPAPPSLPTENLISEPAASAAMSTLSSLASTVKIERLATAPMTSTGLGNGSRTLEDMVIELMRPLLKEWLDQNLPSTVDRLVQKEIERISRRAQD